MKKKRKEFLTYISAYRQTYTYLAVFVLFMLTASRHATIPASVLITSVTMTPMILLNAILRYRLIPRFLHRTRWLYYSHSFLTIIIMTFLAVALDIHIYRFIYLNGYMIIPDEVVETIEVGKTSVGSVYLYAKYLVLLSITMAVVTVSHMLDERKRLEELAKVQHMQQELKYLRAQINPHFLFNALNCIYSLTLTQDEKAPDSVMKLSEMLRFVTDDCRADEVAISKEIAYINNYIDFQKIRMEKTPDLTFTCEISDENYYIPPMLFQPMIENCFKHSRIVDDPKAYIRISLVQTLKELVFTTENSKHKCEFDNKDNERTGIGVINVRQRLELLFHDRYTFDISEDENTYTSKLVIKA